MVTGRSAGRRPGNPLRRRSDVIEAWAGVLLGVLALLVAPAAGVLTGWDAHADAREHARRQVVSRHVVRAELVEDAPDFVASASGTQDDQRYPVVVRWTDPAGRTVVATAPVPAGLDRGDGTAVWLDRSGDVTTPPWGTDDIWSHTLAAAFLVTAAVLGAALTVRLVLRGALDRGRSAAWEREWARVEPDWRRRPN
ncbi:Rv1733c family protein [Streptomyces longispororuber]|uniref:Rv1733c family protein n=1 Tax=Streptomyces longispororuber TaxID=68230 RepID=UPI002109A34B|nr:hypothetical protein [Streptomyces longispororuber]MCQ4207089.1 hypothetical protein [Streptomyces longispororuber]